MKILLDTDVLMDLALNRDPYATAAASLLDQLERHPGMGMVAWHSVSNFYYLVRPAKGRKGSVDFIRELLAFIDVAPSSTTAMRQACDLPMADFEDCMQVAAALAGKVDLIISRNTKDYAKSPVPAMTPKAYLERPD